MVIYVTPAEMNGGILQFSLTMAKTTRELDECLLFLPDSVNEELFSDLKESIVRYKKVKSLNAHNKSTVELAKRIEDKRPDTIIFLEDSLLMYQLNSILHKKGLSTAIVVHDVMQHPYRNVSRRKALVEKMRRAWMRKTVSNKNTFILLSKNSQMYFNDLYKNKNIRTLMMRLGAHVPDKECIRPKELAKSDSNYFLFFGRIDKYKGIENLCKAYEILPKSFRTNYHLLIAGKGILSEIERDYIDSDPHIMLLNRFIDDGEMNWLFSNSTAVVMPYIEASQSGVLPISYYYSKPVLVSDQPGLVENVVEGKTGYVFYSVTDMAEKMKLIVNEENKTMSVNIKNYFESNFNWRENIEELLGSLIHD